MKEALRHRAIRKVCTLLWTRRRESFHLPDAYVIYLSLDHWIHVTKVQCGGVMESTSEQNANSKIFLTHVTLFCTEPCFERCVNVFPNIIAARVNVCLGKRRRFRGKLCGPLKIHYRIRHLSKKEHNVKLADVPLGIKASKRSMYKS